MADFKSCDKCKYCGKNKTEYPCKVCIHKTIDGFTPKTNADRIRTMTNEELAEYFAELIKDTNAHSYSEDSAVWLKWLKEEVKG